MVYGIFTHIVDYCYKYTHAEFLVFYIPKIIDVTEVAFLNKNKNSNIMKKLLQFKITHIRMIYVTV